MLLAQTVFPSPWIEKTLYISGSLEKFKFLSVVVIFQRQASLVERKRISLRNCSDLFGFRLIPNSEMYFPNSSEQFWNEIRCLLTRVLQISCWNISWLSWRKCENLITYSNEKWSRFHAGRTKVGNKKNDNVLYRKLNGRGCENFQKFWESSFLSFHAFNWKSRTPGWAPMDSHRWESIFHGYLSIRID